MRPEGTIYNQKGGQESGEVRVSLTRILKAIYRFIQGASVGIIVLGMVFLLINFAPVALEEVAYYLGRRHIDPQLVDDATDIIEVQSLASSLGVDSHFSIVIPKIGARSKIIANVDPGVESEYRQALMEGVAHARGTYFPGQGNNIFLFSHSTGSSIDVTRFNAVFYLLRKLTKGDEIIIFFADRQYVYTVTEVITAAAVDTHWLTGLSDTEKLILQTCDPPGTSLNRLIVIGEPKNKLVQK
ncbi:hypothetical protein A2801_03665 [Candidatus Woesebacteria bacterium RIFCSPHIGHO2_01_FULL_41_10]|uniref:Sortase n=1 Tax=Candidatus Woesebacteria bacterium RIFCSPHIGHO2_01_FULL_41_10 TaxID=1802500 RepID=A0A1F7YMK6_9BACT|nr:MAG: hypothetical protein A2801_03665 [Candidatus Woesebacteria bacterium RIFCSPHIGHO2_01_FULL_41_10]